MPPRKRKAIGRVQSAAKRMKQRRRQESPEKRNRRLAMQRERAAASRASETVQQREARLQDNRDRARRSRNAQRRGNASSHVTIHDWSLFKLETQPKLWYRPDTDASSNVRDGSAQICAEIKLEIDCDGGDTQTLECSSVFDGKVFQTWTKNVERVRDEMKQEQESSQRYHDSETVGNNGTSMPDLMTGIKQEPEYEISFGITRPECCTSVANQVGNLGNILKLRENAEKPGFCERNEESTVELEKHVKSENISEFVKHDVSFMEFTPELTQNIKSETKNKTGSVCCTSTGGSDKYVTEQRLSEVGELVNVLLCDQTVTENTNISQCRNTGTSCKTDDENIYSFSRKSIQHTLKKSDAVDIQTCDKNFVVHKQYVCEFCNVQFAKISLLHIHLQDIHNQITYLYI